MLANKIANSVQRPKLNIMENLKVDKVVTITDIPRGQLRENVAERLSLLSESPSLLHPKCKKVKYSGKLKKFKQRYKENLTITIPFSTSTGKQGVRDAAVTISWAPTMGKKYGYVRMEYNPDRYRDIQAYALLDKLIGYIFKGHFKAFLNGTRFKRLDLALDVYSDCFTVDDFPMYVKGIGKSDRVSSSHYFGSRTSFLLVRDYMKTVDLKFDSVTPKFRRRIEFQLNWRHKNIDELPTSLAMKRVRPEEVRSLAKMFLKEVGERISFCDIKNLEPSFANRLLAILDEEFTLNEAISRLAQERTRGSGARNRRKALEHQRNRTKLQCDFFAIRSFEKEHVARILSNCATINRMKLTFKNPTKRRPRQSVPYHTMTSRMWV